MFYSQILYGYKQEVGHLNKCYPKLELCSSETSVYGKVLTSFRVWRCSSKVTPYVAPPWSLEKGRARGKCAFIVD